MHVTRFAKFSILVASTSPTELIPSIGLAEVTENQKTAHIPGLHIVADLSSAVDMHLHHFTAFKLFIESEIRKHQLQKVGEVYHNFPSGGFTAVVCLAESHLSIHTWPERNYLTFDIFLSNFMKDNRTITLDVYKSVITFFEATVLKEHLLNR